MVSNTVINKKNKSKLFQGLESFAIFFINISGRARINHTRRRDKPMFGVFGPAFAAINDPIFLRQLDAPIFI